MNRYHHSGFLVNKVHCRVENNSSVQLSHYRYAFGALSLSIQPLPLIWILFHTTPRTDFVIWKKQIIIVYIL